MQYPEGYRWTRQPIAFESNFVAREQHLQLDFGCSSMGAPREKRMLATLSSTVQAGFACRATSTSCA